MLIYINNEVREFSADPTLFDLLHELQLAEKRGLAVAINNQVIPKKAWVVSTLSENDKVTIIQATQGG